jgi:hypothetical protein
VIRGPVALALAAIFAAPAALAAGIGPDAGVAPDDAADAGPAEAPAPLVLTSRLADATIRHLQVIVERKGARLEVTEIATLASRAGTRFRSAGGLRFPLPDGAVAPRTDDAEGERLAAEIGADGFTVTGDIGPGGADLSVSFEVPLAGGTAAFRQTLPVAVEGFQVVCTWTRAGARLRVEGADEGVRDELDNGIVALIAMGRSLEGRPLAVSVTGIEDGAEAWIRRAALALSALLLLAGIWAFVRGRPKGQGGPP